MSQLPCANDTCSIEWSDPETTNPKGRLEANVKLHSNGGIECRTDDAGQGLAINLVGDPVAEEWPNACDVGNMPLRQASDGSLWAAPYPAVKRKCVTQAKLDTASPGRGSGAGQNADEFVALAQPLELVFENDQCYAVEVVPTITVKNAEMFDPGNYAEYALKINGDVPGIWRLFSSDPNPNASYSLSKSSASITPANPNVPTSVLTDASLSRSNSTDGEHVAHSGTIELPVITVAAGAATTIRVESGVNMPYAGLSAFRVILGETRLCITAYPIVPDQFGTTP